MVGAYPPVDRRGSDFLRPRSLTIQMPKFGKNTELSPLFPNICWETGLF